MVIFKNRSVDEYFWGNNDFISLDIWKGGTALRAQQRVENAVFRRDRVLHPELVTQHSLFQCQTLSRYSALLRVVGIGCVRGVVAA